jgi:hypothetical protein
MQTESRTHTLSLNRNRRTPDKTQPRNAEHQLSDITRRTWAGGLRPIRPSIVSTTVRRSRNQQRKCTFAFHRNTDVHKSGEVRVEKPDEKKKKKPLSGTSVPIKQERRKTTASSLRPSVGCPSPLAPMHVLVRITNEQMLAIKTPCHHHSFNLLDTSDLFSFSDKSLRFAKVVVCLYRTKSKKKRKRNAHTT